MYKIINVIKSLLKKYLPKKVYFFCYKTYKYLQYAFSDKTPVTKQELSLANFLSPLFKRVTIDDISFEIKLNPNNGLVDKEIYSKGSWEPNMLREIRKHISKTSICLDIGANIGQHSLYMATVATHGKVYAFDPIPSLAKQIQESVSKNNYNNVEVFTFGLSNENIIKEIYLNNLNMGNTTFKKRLGASSVEKAETKIFDDFWNERAQIDFIKMDVEGYEYYALLGMKKSLEKYKPVMIIEFSPLFYSKMNIDSRDVLTYIFSLGYHIYDLDHNREKITKDNMSAFLTRTTIQTNILCTRT